jgi:hypothetical protein
MLNQKLVEESAIISISVYKEKETKLIIDQGAMYACVLIKLV